MSVRVRIPCLLALTAMLMAFLTLFPGSSAHVHDMSSAAIHATAGRDEAKAVSIDPDHATCCAKSLNASHAGDCCICGMCAPLPLVAFAGVVQGRIMAVAPAPVALPGDLPFLLRPPRSRAIA